MDAITAEEFRFQASILASRWTDGEISDLEYIGLLSALMLRVG